MLFDVSKVTTHASITAKPFLRKKGTRLLRNKR